MDEVEGGSATLRERARERAAKARRDRGIGSRQESAAAEEAGDFLVVVMVPWQPVRVGVVAKQGIVLGVVSSGPRFLRERTKYGRGNKDSGNGSKRTGNRSKRIENDT